MAVAYLPARGTADKSSGGKSNNGSKLYSPSSSSPESMMGGGGNSSKVASKGQLDLTQAGAGVVGVLRDGSSPQFPQGRPSLQAIL